MVARGVETEKDRERQRHYLAAVAALSLAQDLGGENPAIISAKRWFETELDLMIFDDLVAKYTRGENANEAAG